LAAHDDGTGSSGFTYASKDTLLRGSRLDEYLAHGHPDFVIVDEAHRSMSPSYQRVLDRLFAGGSRLLGLTATPDREDGADLSRMWEIAFAYGIVDAIDDKVLIPPYAAVHPIPEMDLSGVGGRKDYIESELEEQLLKAHIVGSARSAPCRCPCRRFRFSLQLGRHPAI
jgi:superfamily II DNA or RNA helicase